MKASIRTEFVLFVTYFSENESNSDLVLEMSSTPAETNVATQVVSKDEDNETKISQYLTLLQLGNFLRELSVLGNTLTCIQATCAEMNKKSTITISKLFLFTGP